MVEVVQVFCPHCGEVQEISIQPDDLGEMVQDCPVCCRPWKVLVMRDEWGDPRVEVERLEE